MLNSCVLASDASPQDSSSSSVIRQPDIAELGPLDLPNEISAPYEVPQFPIEQIEGKLALQRQITKFGLVPKSIKVPTYGASKLIFFKFNGLFHWYE